MTVRQATTNTVWWALGWFYFSIGASVILTEIMDAEELYIGNYLAGILFFVTGIVARPRGRKFLSNIGVEVSWKQAVVVYVLILFVAPYISTPLD